MSRKKRLTDTISNLVNKKVRFFACVLISLVVLIGVLLLYYFLPILLNYGPRHN